MRSVTVFKKSDEQNSENEGNMSMLYNNIRYLTSA